MSFADRVVAYRERADSALGRWLPAAATHPERFHTAIRYAVLGGGRRLRPVLVYAAAEWLEVAPERVDGIAVAIELVHAYALAHHDLPAMNGRAARRGRAAAHVAFDDATAILAGDALQAHAYCVLASDARLAVPAVTRRQLLRDLAAACGSRGMVGGEAGSLFRAAAIMPCRLRPDGGGSRLAVAERYGRAMGLAFQIANDLGERGAGHSPARLEELRADALAAVAGEGAGAEGLRWVCDQALSRDR